MSFLNYVENKISYKRPVLSMDDYKQKLEEQVYALQKTGGLSRHFLDLTRIGRLLHEINYPDRDKFLIIISSENLGKIRKLSSDFVEWSKKCKSPIVKELQDYFTKIKSHIYFNKELDINDAKQIVASKLAETEFESKDVLQTIEAIIRFAEWGNTEIVVEPILQVRNDFVADEFKICIGENYFIYCKKLIGIEIKDGQLNEDVLEIEKLQWLRNRINKKPIKEFVKLYFTQSRKNRKFFEKAKTDLSLGRAVTLPSHLRFTDYIPEIQENEDVWKVKMERKYLIENSNKYEIIGEDVPFRWLELIEDSYEK